MLSMADVARLAITCHAALAWARHRVSHCTPEDIRSLLVNLPDTSLCNVLTHLAEKNRGRIIYPPPGLLIWRRRPLDYLNFGYSPILLSEVIMYEDINVFYGQFKSRPLLSGIDAFLPNSEKCIEGWARFTTFDAEVRWALRSLYTPARPTVLAEDGLVALKKARMC